MMNHTDMRKVFAWLLIACASILAGVLILREPDESYNFTFSSQVFLKVSKNIGLEADSVDFQFVKENDRSFAVTKKDQDGSLLVGSQIQSKNRNVLIYLYVKDSYLTYPYSDQQKRDVEKVINDVLLSNAAGLSESPQKGTEAVKKISSELYPFKLL